MVFYDKTVHKVKKKNLCLTNAPTENSLLQKEIAHVWFNTAFIDDNKLTVSKSEIDKLWQDRKHKKYHPDIQIIFEFEGSEVSVMSSMKKKAKKKRKSKKERYSIR